MEWVKNLVSRPRDRFSPRQSDHFSGDSERNFNDLYPKEVPDASRPSFRHAPLEDGHMRLLRIKSITGGTPHCELMHIPYEETRSHYAISYCWGDGPADRKVLINNASFNVNANQHAALTGIFRHLKSADKADSELWMDAICINQTDKEEKSRQVRQISHIFKSASSTIIWLGDEHDTSGTSTNTEMAMDILQWSSNLTSTENPEENQSGHSLNLRKLLSARSVSNQQFLELTDSVERDYGIRRENLDLLHLLSEDLHKDLRENNGISKYKDNICAVYEGSRYALKQDNPFWSSLLELMDHPWFERLWTYEEVMLSRQDKSIAIAKRGHVPWQTLLKYREAIIDSRAHYRLCLDEYLISHPDLRDNITVGARPFRRPLAVDGVDFLYLLLYTSQRRSMRPVDHVFGILGLTDERIRSMIAVDYKKSISDVFTNATRVLCELEGMNFMLTFLLEWYMVSPWLNEKGLPSWCPDLSQRLPVNNPISASSDRERFLSDEAALRKYASVTIHESTYVLTINGFEIAMIASSCRFCFYPSSLIPESTQPGLTHSERFTAMLRSDWQGCYQCWKEINETFFSDETQRSGMSQSWLRSVFLSPDEQAASEVSRSTAQDTLDQMYRLVKLSTRIMTPDDSRIFDVSMLADIDHEIYANIDKLWPIFQSGMRNSSGRYFFLTTCQRIGYSSSIVSPGDRICYLPGGYLLHVLSADAKRYVGIGRILDLNIPDILKLVESGDLLPTTFHLE